MNKKILIIDDDFGILDAISMVLKDSGYVVETEMKGEHVFDKIQEFKPELIILDILMSGSDGRTICKNLKKNDATKNIPIILTSAHPSIAKYAKEYGADGFIAKPFEIDNLLDVAKKYLS